MEADTLKDWSYIKYNVTDCATQCPTGVDSDTGSALAVCEEAKRECFCLNGYYFEDSSRTKCVHIYNDLTWPYIVHYTVAVPTLLLYVVAIIRLSHRKVTQHIRKIANKNRNKQAITFLEKARVWLYGNYVIRSLNLVLLYAMLKFVRECFMFFLPVRWEQSLNTSIYIAFLASVNMFVQFSILTSKMVGKKKRQQKEGCCNITIGDTPIVKILRRIFYAVTIICFVLANVTIFDKNIPELYRVVFTQYIVAVFVGFLATALIYYGCKYSTRRAKPTQNLLCFATNTPLSHS